MLRCALLLLLAASAAAACVRTSETHEGVRVEIYAIQQGILDLIRESQP
jgi:hypothetical protein